MKAIYNLTTKVLIVLGDEIQNFIETIDEMGEWRTLYDKEGNPLFDVQLDFDDSIDKGRNTTLNPNNYNVQYVNLIKTSEDSETYSMGDNWKNIELTIIIDKPSVKILGTKKN